MYTIDPIDIIVFSKNRAMQLHLMLRTFFRTIDFPCKMSIIYKADTEEFERGYFILKEMYPKIDFIHEYNLKNDILYVLQNKLCLFLSDDCIFINSISENDKNSLNMFYENKDILAISMSLSKNVFTKWDIIGPESHIATLDNLNIWGWNVENRRQFDTWFTPMQLIGNIFRVDDIKPIISNEKFKTVIDLEHMLTCNIIDRPCMSCFESAKLCELALNKVQNQRFYPSFSDESLNIEKLNELFLNKMQIQIFDIKEGIQILTKEITIKIEIR